MRSGDWPLVGRDEELRLLGSLVARPDAGGVVIAGESGTGKTRLAMELVAAAARTGQPTQRIIASRAAASIPLGAFASLLPPLDGRAATVELIQVAAEALRALAGNGRLVLLVDDAHLLDDASAALLAQVLLGGRVFTVATLRSSEVAPDAVTTIWKDGLAHRLDLQDLGPDETARLLRDALGGEVDPASAYTLWQQSAGNPLFLRELVLGAMETGVLEQADRVWALRSRLAAPPSLREIIRARVAEVSGAAREALSTVALADSVGLADLDALHGHDAVELLELGGLVVVTASERRTIVALAHPLYGEVLRDELPATVSRRLAAALTARLRQIGIRRRDDVLRLVTLQLTAGLPPDPAQLRQAAAHAHQAGEFPTAERLARMAPQDPGARLLLAQILDESGRQANAEEVLFALAPDELAPEVAARAALLRSDVLFFGLGREADAIAILDLTGEAVGGRTEIGELVANRGWLELHAGRPHDALASVSHLHGAADPLVAVAAAIVASRALGIVGRTGEALAQAERAIAIGNGVRPANRHSDFPSLVQGYALLHGGSLAAAEAVAQRGLAGAVVQRPTFLHAHWLSLLGSTRAAQGQLASAASHFRQAAALQRRLGQPGLLRWNLAALALATVQGGLPDEAAAALVEYHRIGERPERLLDGDAVRAEAWLQMTRGRTPDALVLLATAARLAREAGAVTLEIECLHDQARLGDADSVLERLTDLDHDSPASAVRIGHAAALANGSPDALVDAARRFETSGALLLAAEAQADAARAHQRAGRMRDAQRHRVRAGELVDRCEGADTPALAVGDEVVPLTPREREIVRMAAAGLTNRQIAEQLVVSVRTVDNLLHRAYVKLGVSNRHAAGAAVGMSVSRLPAPGR